MSSKKNIKAIANKIRDIHDFPKKGIIFKDITPVLSDIETFRKKLWTSVKKLRNKSRKRFEKNRFK